jgi:hypothetical protein
LQKRFEIQSSKLWFLKWYGNKKFAKILLKSKLKLLISNDKKSWKLKWLQSYLNIDNKLIRPPKFFYGKSKEFIDFKL